MHRRQTRQSIVDPLKTTPLLALLLLANAALADDLAVFGRDEFYPAGAAPALGSGDRLAFFNAYSADVAARRPLETTMALVNPPSWGKTVSAGTLGSVSFHPEFTGGFVCHLSLDGLAPAHRYILTLNGNPQRAGNALLPSPVPGNEAEKYYDFLFITTDARGHFDGGLGVFLKPGAYDVRCYVKDASDFKIVLYRDFFPFSVR